jgi:hypothetical protein
LAQAIDDDPNHDPFNCLFTRLQKNAILLGGMRVTCMIIPRKLVDRDPRNHTHRAAAFNLLRIVATPTITARTDREVRRIIGSGVMRELVGDCTVTPTIPSQDVIMIGAMFFFEEGLLFADNVLIACKGCKTPLQIRPESLLAKDHWCLFCAADQALTEYWTTKDSRTEK